MDPNFNYDVLRPIAVVAGYAISFRIGWSIRDWLIRRRERRAAIVRNVTPPAGTRT